MLIVELIYFTYVVAYACEIDWTAVSCIVSAMSILEGQCNVFVKIICLKTRIPTD